MRLAKVLLFSCLIAVACSPGVDDASAPCVGVVASALEPRALDLLSPDVSRDNLRAWVELLTSPQLRGRHAGEDGADGAADLIAKQMVLIGLASPAPDQGVGRVPSKGGYCRGFPFLGEADHNVVGHLMPESDATARPVVLLTAHYDGQGVHPAGRIYPGADDNASGIAGLMEVARLVVQEPDPQVAWVFVAFGAEETGQLGARAFMSTPTVDLSRIELAINLDMIGRNSSAELQGSIGYQALGRATRTTQLRLRAAADALGVQVGPLGPIYDQVGILSDAQVLAERLPTLLLSTGLHEDHHRVTDTPEKIDYLQVERTVRLVLALAETLGRGDIDSVPS